MVIFLWAGPVLFSFGVRSIHLFLRNYRRIPGPATPSTLGPMLLFPSDLLKFDHRLSVEAIVVVGIIVVVVASVVRGSDTDIGFAGLSSQ